MAETKILAGIIVFWFVLSTGLYFYEEDNYGSFGSHNIDMNDTVSNLDETSGETGSGILEVFDYIGTFFKLITFYTPIFDNTLITALINIVIWSLRLITLYLILRLIRGGA